MGKYHLFVHKLLFVREEKLISGENNDMTHPAFASQAIVCILHGKERPSKPAGQGKMPSVSSLYNNTIQNERSVMGVFAFKTHFQRSIMPYEPLYIKQRMRALSRCLQNASASNVYHEPSSPLLKLTAMAKGVAHIALPKAALLRVYRIRQH